MWRRLILALAIVVGTNAATIQPSDAFFRTCARIIAKYIGKPFVAGLAKEAGSQTARYFAEKMRQGGANAVEEADVEELRQMGVSECEIRSFLETADAEQAITYSAVARCGITGAEGTANHFSTPQDAMGAAIGMCVSRGGIPECCARGAEAYSD